MRDHSQRPLSNDNQRNSLTQYPQHIHTTGTKKKMSNGLPPRSESPTVPFGCLSVIFSRNLHALACASVCCDSRTGCCGPIGHVASTLCSNLSTCCGSVFSCMGDCATPSPEANAHQCDQSRLLTIHSTRPDYAGKTHHRPQPK